MATRKMPLARAERPQGKQLLWDLSPKALDKWHPQLAAVAPSAASDNTISVYDPIGYDPWTGDGVTANRIAAALRTIGDKNDVVVNINSPGGDMFEGLAIYNLLRQHGGQVTVKVVGLAASAASIIAMAGDTIQIARAGFYMVHDCWIMAMGNRNDMREVADMLEPFDRAMADIYAARAGMTGEEALALMDAETWIGGQAAIDQGFADELLPSDQVTTSARADGKIAAYLLDLALAKAGLPRSERRSMLQQYKAGTQNAAGGDVPGGAPPAARSAPAPQQGEGQPAAQEATPCAGAEVLGVLKAFSFETELQSLSASIQGARS